MTLRRLGSRVGRGMMSWWVSAALFGSYWMPIPTEQAPFGPFEPPRPKPPQEPERPARPARTAGLAPSHPERLCPERPLDEVEQRLQEELPPELRQLSRRLG